MNPFEASLSPQQCLNKVKEHIFPFYKECFPFDDKVSATAIACLNQTPDQVSDLSIGSCAMSEPNYYPGWKFELVYKEQKVTVSISSNGFYIRSVDEYEREQNCLSRTAKQFLLNKLKETIPNEHLSSVNLSYLEGYTFNKDTLKKVFDFSRGRSRPDPTRMQGWIIEVRSTASLLKFRLYDNPNETCWRVKEIGEGETHDKKVRRNRTITSAGLNANIAAAKENPVKMARLQRIKKENIVSEEDLKGVKEKVVAKLKKCFPFENPVPADIILQNLHWRNDLNFGDFEENCGKVFSEMVATGFEADCTYKDESFKVRFSSAAAVRCHGIKERTK